VNSEAATTQRDTVAPRGRWFNGRQPTGATEVDPRSVAVLTDTEGHRNEHR